MLVVMPWMELEHLHSICGRTTSTVYDIGQGYCCDQFICLTIDVRVSLPAADFHVSGPQIR